jgi:hypothetical protein
MMQLTGTRADAWWIVIFLLVAALAVAGVLEYIHVTNFVADFPR